MGKPPTPREALDAYHAGRRESQRVVVSERRMMLLKLTGWSLDAVRSRKDGVVVAYESSLRPEGLDYPLTDRKGGRKRKPVPKAGDFIPWYRRYGD